jgi:hypothetical protein
LPTPTYTPLATVTLGTSAASVTFSSIPATYRDLILVTNLLGDFSLDIRLNGDTGFNYGEVAMNGSSFGATSSSNASRDRMRLDDYGFTTVAAGQVNITQIMDYSATDKHKTALARANNAANGVAAVAAIYRSTSAITSITFINGGNAGSRYDLYGVIA